MEQFQNPELANEYDLSLQELTLNSKPMINSLTMVAEENLRYSKDLVQVLVLRLSKAPVEQLLPLIYVLDSILKNVGGIYVALIAPHLGRAFSDSFARSDGATRHALLKVLQTWVEARLFAPDVLQALESHARLVLTSAVAQPPPQPQPSVPQAASSTHAVHLNPSFFAPVSPALAPGLASASHPASAYHEHVHDQNDSALLRAEDGRARRGNRNGGFGGGARPLPLRSMPSLGSVPLGSLPSALTPMTVLRKKSPPRRRDRALDKMGANLLPEDRELLHQKGSLLSAANSEPMIKAEQMMHKESKESKDKEDKEDVSGEVMSDLQLEDEAEADLPKAKSPVKDKAKGKLRAKAKAKVKEEPKTKDVKVKEEEEEDKEAKVEVVVKEKEVKEEARLERAPGPGPRREEPRPDMQPSERGQRRGGRGGRGGLRGRGRDFRPYEERPLSRDRERDWDNRDNRDIRDRERDWERGREWDRRRPSRERSLPSVPMPMPATYVPHLPVHVHPAPLPLAHPMSTFAQSPPPLHSFAPPLHPPLPLHPQPHPHPNANANALPLHSVSVPLAPAPAPAAPGADLLGLDMSLTTMLETEALLLKDLFGAVFPQRPPLFANAEALQRREEILGEIQSRLLRSMALPSQVTDILKQLELLDELKKSMAPPPALNPPPMPISLPNPMPNPNPNPQPQSQMIALSALLQPLPLPVAPAAPAPSAVDAGPSFDWLKSVLSKVGPSPAPNHHLNLNLNPNPNPNPTPLGSASTAPKLLPKSFDVRDPRSLKLRNDAAIAELYDQPFRCEQCGLRFREQDRLQPHLDAHFRQNRREKERTKKAQSRLWYQTEPQWVDSTEVGAEAPLPFDLGLESEPHTPDRADEGLGFGLGLGGGQGGGLGGLGGAGGSGSAVVVMRSGEERPLCAACFEPIEVEWDDDRDQWIARDAVRDGDDLYHLRCIAATHDEHDKEEEEEARTKLKRSAQDAMLDEDAGHSAKRARSDVQQ